jgi:glycosyltransferase involved in cell wall biosynthesis
LELGLRNKFYYQLKFKNNQPFVSKPEWFSLKAKMLEVPDLSQKYIPDADIVIATAWETAEWVNSYAPNKGTKFYFIQHYEVWAGPKKRVEQTYKLPLKKITIASWLKEKIEKDLGEKVLGFITNGVNFDHFYNPSKKYNFPRRIGMLYHEAPWKGVEDGLKAFFLAREKFSDLQLVMFGVKKPKDKHFLNQVEFYENPSQEKLREVYCSLDIFLSPSWTEGCQLPPMEAMACKCAVVATDVGGIPDYAIAGKTALISPPRNPQALAENLITLLQDETKLKQITEAGYQYIKNFTWEQAAKKLEKILLANK